MRTGNYDSAFCGPRADRAGFTLIEILAVIGIIGLLAAATLVAVGGSRGFFRAATAKMRLDDVAQAVELYKQKFGEYPPDCCATDAEIQHHILKRWPKSLKNRAGMPDMVAFARAEMTRTPGSALLFWLAGPPEIVPVAGSTETACEYQGFFSDPINPFGLGLTDVEMEKEPRVEPLIELTFDSGKSNGNYNENGFVFNGQIMAYFRATPKKGYDFKDYHWTGPELSVAPYMKGGRWYMPDSFQLILPGEDGIYSTVDSCVGEESEEEHEHGHHGDFEPHDLNDPDSVSPEDMDNITNFSNGATLASEKD